MSFKEAILKSEKQQVAGFLARCGLTYESNIDQTLYFEEDGEVIGTVSASKYVIKCLAVDPRYRGENLALTLVSELLKRFQSGNIHYYQVFTKLEYRAVFVSLGFRPLLETEKIAVMEGGDGDIYTTLDRLRIQMKFSLGINDFNQHNDIGCVIINGNPFTLGHQQLVEYAMSKHRYVIVFVLEEEGSMFTFKERFAMAYLALKPYYNVLILPSTKYIVSKATFPSYFLRNADESTEEYAKYDAMIFEKYFVPTLGISKRYVGSESTEYMKIYNDTLKKVLKDRLEIVPRFEENGEAISAKRVRSLIKSGNIDAALSFVPKNNSAVLRGIIASKNE